MQWIEWRKHLVNGVFTLLALGFVPLAAAVDWPQELEGKEGTVVIYQPQVDAIEGNQLKARAAMSIEMKSGGDPIFGAMWMTADIETDRGEDIARISNCLLYTSPSPRDA